MGQIASLLSKITVAMLSPLAHHIAKENLLDCVRRERDLETFQSLHRIGKPPSAPERHVCTVPPACCHDAESSANLEYSLCPLGDMHKAIADYALDKFRVQTTVLAFKFGMNITRCDMCTLNLNNWLNENIIDFYMKLIKDRGDKEGTAFPQVFTFNSQFYSKLIKDGPFSIKRWTKNVNIFCYQMALIPLHIGLHWCLVGINFVAKTVVYYDSCIKAENNCLIIIMRYLAEEHQDKLGVKLDTREWVMKFAKRIPQEVNACDCGVFACTYAEFLSRGAPFIFTSEDVPRIRRRMSVEIMIGELMVQ